MHGSIRDIINEYTGQSSFIPARDYFSYSITSYAFANLDKKKKTTAFVFLSYNGVNMNAQSKTYSIPFYGLGVQNSIKDHSFRFILVTALFNEYKIKQD